MRAKVEACLAAFVHDGNDGSPPVLGNENVDEDEFNLAPGAVIRLRNGQQVTTLTPSSAGGQIEFIRQSLRAAAASLGMGYDQLASDPSQANYSSLRTSRLEFKKQVENDQWGMMIPQMCQPIFSKFCSLGTAIGLWPDFPALSEWMPPSFELLDPSQEIPAIRDAIRAGLMSPQQAILAQGFDPDEQLAALAEWNAKLDASGIILDSDARKVSQQGQLQRVENQANISSSNTESSGEF
jgi:capsid protein